MTYGIHASFDAIREVLFGSITASYSVVGGPLTHEARIIQFLNSTDKDVYLSTDAVTAFTRVPGRSGTTLNFCSNKVQSDGFFLPIGTQFYVKRTEAGAPGDGSLSIDVIYATPAP